MNKNELMQRGSKHFADGKMMTPFDCQAIDKEIFAAVKTAERPFKLYAQLRGAFNKGWMKAHAQSFN